MTSNSDNGIVSVPSRHSVDRTVENLKEILEAKGIKLFALVDHSGEAEKIGMQMRPTKLLIFGNPKAGTPLMLASPSIALDLPLKILIWEDGRQRSSLDLFQQPRVPSDPASSAARAPPEHRGRGYAGGKSGGVNRPPSPPMLSLDHSGRPLHRHSHP